MHDPENHKGGELNQLVIFLIDGQRYALQLSVVDRIVRVVEISPLPKAPDIVLGVVNIQGEIVPIFNVRKRFGFPDREINLSDQLIVAHTSKRNVALLVDTVMDTVAHSREEIVMASKILPRMEYVEGVVKLPDGIAFIHDLEKFLNLEETQSLEEAMGKHQRASDA